MAGSDTDIRVGYFSLHHWCNQICVDGDLDKSTEKEGGSFPFNAWHW